MSNPGWSSTSTDHARHRQGFPPRFCDMIAREGLFAPGMRVLDLGTGPDRGGAQPRRRIPDRGAQSALAHGPHHRLPSAMASDLSLARFTRLAFAGFDHEAACPRAD
jgi:hypothetical protein